MFDHASAAVMGLYPGKTTPFSVTTMGWLLLEVPEETQVVSPRGAGAALTRDWRRNKVEDDNRITVNISFNGKYWQREYENKKYARVALRAKLAAQKQIAASRKNVSVSATINKPEVKLVVTFKK